MWDTAYEIRILGYRVRSHASSLTTQGAGFWLIPGSIFSVVHKKLSAIKPLTLSLVIPVYNEESYLKACLDSVATQTIKPLQVIVVDNNSTDKTASIAQKFPFVTLLRESRQSQVFAEATGFDAVTADIIGRLDADTILPPDWVSKVLARFTQNNALAAISGSPRPYDVTGHLQIAIKAFQLYHNYGSSFIAGHQLLWGSNAAFKQSLWPKVKNSLHYRADIWEDYDLSFALAKYGYILWDKDLSVGCSFRLFEQPTLRQLRYHLRAVRTFWLNTSWWRSAAHALLRSSLVFSIIFAKVARFIDRLFNDQ